MDNGVAVFDKDKSFGLKGISIILMLFHHLFRLPELFSAFTVSFYPLREMNVVNMAYTSKICVSIFAFISGYGLYCSYKRKNETAQRWVFRRYLKTFSGYWFVWIIAFILCQVIDGRSLRIFYADGFYKGIIYTALNFLGLDNLFATPSINAVWWYMGAAIVFIALIPIIYNCKDNMLLLIICTIVLPRAILGHDGSVIKASGMSAFAFLIPYMAGSVFARYNLFERCFAIGRNQPIKKAYKFILELWMVVFLYKIYNNLDRGLFWEIHYGVFPVICILFLVEFMLSIKWLNKLLMFLGKHSFNMYLIHALLLTYVKSFLYSCKHFALITVVFIGVSLILSIIIEYLKQVTRYNKLISLIFQFN